MKNLAWIFFLLLFSLQFISSLEMGISPAYLDLDGKVEEKVCRNISIYADRDINTTIKDRWTKIDKSRKIKDYNLSSEDFALKVIAREKVLISANKTKETEICFSGENAGNFYGAVLFESERGYASIGSWINLKIKGKEGNIISLTGNAIEKIEGGNWFFIGLFSIVVEGIVLFLLIRKMRKKKIKKSGNPNS